MDMAIVNDVTSSMNAMHLSNNNEWMETRMEVDHWAPTQTEHVDEKIYSSIMSEVVGGHENAFAVLASTMHDLNCFVVNLTRAELEKLVELDNERIRGIYPPYKAA
ncbi:hypothetical protein Tco_1226451 [Tanacetum coccineum]